MLIIAAIVTGVGVADGLLDIPNISSKSGEFLVDAYGILAIAVPFYLLWGAVLVLDPTFRPSRVFVMIASLAPFTTIAVGTSYYSRFDHLSNTSDFLKDTGRLGFALVLAFSVLVQVLVIILISELRFKERPKKEEESDSDVEASELSPYNPDDDPPQGGGSKKYLLMTLQDTAESAKKSKNSFNTDVKNKNNEKNSPKDTTGSFSASDLDIDDLPPPPTLQSAKAYKELLERQGKAAQSVKPHADETQFDELTQYEHEDAAPHLHGSRRPGAYIDNPDPFERTPDEITDNATYPEQQPNESKKSETGSVPVAVVVYEDIIIPSSYSGLERPPSHQPAAYIPLPEEPFGQSPEEITDAAFPDNTHDRRDKPQEPPPRHAPHKPAAYIPLPEEPFGQSPEEITDAAFPDNTHDRRDKPQEPPPRHAPHKPAAYIPLPEEPFGQSPEEITDAAFPDNYDRRDKPQEPPPRHAPHKPAAYIPLPEEPFGQSPEEITDAAFPDNTYDRRDKPQEPPPRHAPHKPAAYIPLPEEPFGQSPEEITDAAFPDNTYDRRDKPQEPPPRPHPTRQQSEAPPAV